ncbi:hypothetical protein ACLOJK_007968 [Asimina triloba]
MEEEGEAAAADFSCLNESCISHILSLTSPLDVSRSSAVSTLFRSAADSDAIWDRFLPPDYPQILSTSTSSALHFSSSSKKDLFFRLCDDPILLDGATKMSYVFVFVFVFVFLCCRLQYEVQAACGTLVAVWQNIFWLEKSSGRKCYALPARELLIIWRDMPTRWRWISQHESRIAEVAELLGVNWLEISGKFDIRMLSSETTYSAFLVLKFTEDTQGLGHRPMELMVKVEGNVCKNDALLLTTESERQRYHSKLEQVIAQLNTLRGAWMTKILDNFMKDLQIPVARTDGWLEIEMGEFFVGKRGRGEVEMSLMEIKGGYLKSGLIIQGIEIRPKK